MKQKALIGVMLAVIIVLLWMVAWGDLAEWRYSKNLHCMTYQNARKVEICKSIEKYQEYGSFGHAMISLGYRATFFTAKNAWCELSLTEADLDLLKEMQYDLSLAPQLMDGSGLLYGLLDAGLHPDSSLYIGSVYEPASPYYLLKEGCSK